MQSKSHPTQPQEPLCLESSVGIFQSSPPESNKTYNAESTVATATACDSNVTAAAHSKSCHRASDALLVHVSDSVGLLYVCWMLYAGRSSTAAHLTTKESENAVWHQTHFDIAHCCCCCCSREQEEAEEFDQSLDLDLDWDFKGSTTIFDYRVVASVDTNEYYHYIHFSTVQVCSVSGSPGRKKTAHLTVGSC